jgi:hypothetical protein
MAEQARPGCLEVFLRIFKINPFEKVTEDGMAPSVVESLRFTPLFTPSPIFRTSDSHESHAEVKIRYKNR